MYSRMSPASIRPGRPVRRGAGFRKRRRPGDGPASTGGSGGGERLAEVGPGGRTGPPGRAVAGPSGQGEPFRVDHGRTADRGPPKVRFRTEAVNAKQRTGAGASRP